MSTKETCRIVSTSVRLHRAPFILFWLLALQTFLPLHGQPIVDTWKYTLRRPVEGWRRVDFDTNGWNEGQVGFGTLRTPGARIGTVWATRSIWLRKTIAIDEIPTKPALLIHHDENAEVYLNGKSVGVFKGFTRDYKVVPIPAGKRDAIKRGENVMAVHCSQTTGGQFIDVHLVDADNVPKLPTPKRNTKPFVSQLITKWGANVTPDNAWTEYPRPQLTRNNWTNLNGHWDYAVTPIEQTNTPESWNGKILVPFCLGIEARRSPASARLDRGFVVPPYLRRRTTERRASETQL